MTTTAHVVLITGPAGAGRSTAIRAFEDLGFETIDNMPLSLIPALLNGQKLDRPLAFGVDARTRDFNVKSVIDLSEAIEAQEGYSLTLLYVDCSTSVLLRRYSETRRRHPLAPEEAPQVGIAHERDLLHALKSKADVYIDTSESSPHELKSEIGALFGGDSGEFLAVNLQSFSYKRGVPRGIDMVFDCRFLRNPYWDESLRGKTGLEAAVRDYIKEDKRYDDFFKKTSGLIEMLLPAYREEGKAHFTIGMGCTGGRHRSVCLAEELAAGLDKAGWKVKIRHRELERHASG